MFGLFEDRSKNDRLVKCIETYASRGAILKCLNDGANIDGKDRDGDTPLHKAALYNNIEAMQVLISRGADIEAVNKMKRTPLAIAAMNGNGEAARLLIGSRADVDARDVNGATPMILAADEGHKDTVRLLLESGANRFLRDKTRAWTAEDYARGNRGIVSLFRNASHPAVPQGKKTPQGQPQKGRTTP